MLAVAEAAQRRQPRHVAERDAARAEATNAGGSVAVTTSASCQFSMNITPIITNSVSARPLTVGLQVFSSTDQGIDWSIITAATLMTSAPLLIGFLLFQRQFVQSFMRAGIK